MSKEAGERIQVESNQRSISSSKSIKTSKHVPFSNIYQQVSSASALLGDVQEGNSKLLFCRKSGYESGNCYSAKKKIVQNQREIVKNSKLSFNCLKPSNPGHNYRSCRQPSCTAEGSGMKHHQLLHSGTQHNQSTSLSGCIIDLQKTTQVLLQTAIANLVVGSQELAVRIMFDTGSQRSYIRKDIVESFDLSGPIEVLSISTLGGNTTKYSKMQRIKFSIKKLDSELNGTCIDIEALAIHQICAPLQPVHFDPSQYHHLDRLILADNYQRDAEQVDILVGVDFYYSIIENSIERSMNNNGLIAIKLKLGWILCGQIESRKQERVATMISTVEEDICNTLKSF